MSSPTFVPLHTGDVNDDDPRVLDSFLTDSTEPPDLSKAVEPVPPEIKAKPYVASRMLSGDTFIGGYTDAVNPWNSATLLLPADPNRKSLYMRVRSVSATATDNLQVADDAGKTTATGRLFHTQDATFIDHTGPVWVSAPAGGMYVSFWAVTS